MWYVLDDDHNPVPSTVEQWGEWQRKRRRMIDAGFEDPNRVAFTEIGFTGISVSTVFLGLDHGFGGTFGQAPILFETMCFYKTDMDGMDSEMRRYATWREAEVGHREVVAIIRRKLMRIVG